MTESFAYTDEFDFECADCGFCEKSVKCPANCPACGSEAVSIVDAALDPLRNFVYESLVEVGGKAPGSGFWVAKVPVVQIVWRLVTGENPSRFRGDELPVECVSQTDCIDFIKRFNANEIVDKSGFVFRLPTSAEWSLFARHGRRRFSNVAWSWDNSECSTHPVATKKPNPLGLFDLWGNVWEWCSDVDDRGAVCRGGCWCCDKDGCMVEELWPAETRSNFIGLRLCADRRS